MRILGIETSCDETAAAVVDDGRLIRSNVVASQIPIHERFGGVVPEIASRQHILAIGQVVSDALKEGATLLAEVDAIAVTYGPGLSGPLLVGMNFAKGLALGLGIPLLTVNHLEAHMLSVWLVTGEDSAPEPALPMVSLIVSGGHTELVLVERPGRYRVLGRTLDDAAGEAFDKVGRLLGLEYPGGPSIERTAALVCPADATISLPRAWLRGTHDFSFSGLKTAVVREVRSAQVTSTVETISAERAQMLAWAFQDSVADVLSQKLSDAAKSEGSHSASLVGGVANNSTVRAACERRLMVPLYVPGPGLCTDNAGMVAGAAYWNPRKISYEQDIAPSLGLSA